MTTEMTQRNGSSLAEQALIQGDLANLTADQRVSYYQQVCNSLGLNVLTKPFEYIKLNGRLTLYARRDATDQLRKKHQVSVEITARERQEDIYVVTVKAQTVDGRTDSSIGAVAIAGLKGEPLANALMKAETKAKRRVTLSICGLGMLDETEVATIAPEAEPREPTKQIEPPTGGFRKATRKQLQLMDSLRQQCGYSPGDMSALIEDYGANRSSELSSMQADEIIALLSDKIAEKKSEQPQREAGDGTSEADQ